MLFPLSRAFGFEHRDQLLSETIRIDERVFDAFLEKVIRGDTRQRDQNSDGCSDQRFRNSLHDDFRPLAGGSSQVMECPNDSENRP